MYRRALYLFCLVTWRLLVSKGTLILCSFKWFSYLTWWLYHRCSLLNSSQPWGIWFLWKELGGFYDWPLKHVTEMFFWKHLFLQRRVLQEIKLNTSQLHSALRPRFWKGRWSENHQLSAYTCVLRLPQRWVLYACVPLVEAWQYPALRWALRGHFGPCPAGPDHCFVPACLDNFSFLYTSNICWTGDGDRLFLYF